MGSYGIAVLLQNYYYRDMYNTKAMIPPYFFVEEPVKYTMSYLLCINRQAPQQSSISNPVESDSEPYAPQFCLVGIDDHRKPSLRTTYTPE